MCHDPVNRNARTGPDTTAACLQALREARGYLDGLPSNRSQNYEAHVAFDAVEDLVKSIAAGVCVAMEKPQ